MIVLTCFVTGGTGNWGWVSAWAVTGGTGVNGLRNKTNKDKMLRTMVLSFVYSPTAELSEHMSASGKIVKRCLADTIRPPEISVFFMVSLHGLQWVGSPVVIVPLLLLWPY